MTPTINETDAHCSVMNFARIMSRPFVGTMNCRFICLSFLMVTGTKPGRMCNTYQISILLSPPVRIDRALQIRLTDFNGRSCCSDGYPNKIGERIRYAAGHFLGEEYAIRHARITRIGAPS